MLKNLNDKVKTMLAEKATNEAVIMTLIQNPDILLNRHTFFRKRDEGFHTLVAMDFAFDFLIGRFLHETFIEKLLKFAGELALK